MFRYASAFSDVTSMRSEVSSVVSGPPSTAPPPSVTSVTSPSVNDLEPKQADLVPQHSKSPDMEPSASNHHTEVIPSLKFAEEVEEELRRSVSSRGASVRMRSAEGKQNGGVARLSKEEDDAASAAAAVTEAANTAADANAERGKWLTPERSDDSPALRQHSPIPMPLGTDHKHGTEKGATSGDEETTRATVAAVSRAPVTLPERDEGPDSAPRLQSVANSTPISPPRREDGKLTASSLKNSFGSMGSTMKKENSNVIAINKPALQEILSVAVDELRMDLGSALNSIHIDMIRQFQSMSDEIEGMGRELRKEIGVVRKENEVLRKENEKLRSII